jgi:hypothetical protein
MSDVDPFTYERHLIGNVAQHHCGSDITAISDALFLDLVVLITVMVLLVPQLIGTASIWLQAEADETSHAVTAGR